MLVSTTGLFGTTPNHLMRVCYSNSIFSICRVAEWAYMAVVVLEDTTCDEYEESRITFAAWHIDADFGQKIMANPVLFSATILSKQTGREPDLTLTIRDLSDNPLVDIRQEVRSGQRQPIEDPVLDRIFKEQETKRLKVFWEKYGDDPQFSDKKVWPGMLMLLLYPLGLPFFYFNKPRWAYLMIACMVVSCIVLPLVVAGGLLGCVLIVKLLLELAKDKLTDKNGRTICTRKRQALIRNNIATYKKNLAELEAEDAKI